MCFFTRLLSFNSISSTIKLSSPSSKPTSSVEPQSEFNLHSPNCLMLQPCLERRQLGLFCRWVRSSPPMSLGMNKLFCPPVRSNRKCVRTTKRMWPMGAGIWLDFFMGKLLSSLIRKFPVSEEQSPSPSIRLLEKKKEAKLVHQAMEAQKEVRFSNFRKCPVWQSLHPRWPVVPS